MATRRKAKKVTPKRKPAATSALKRALAERDEALKFQAATQEILASIRSSVTDAQPVFDAIVKNVLSLFGTRYAAVFVINGEEMHLLASKGDADLEKRRVQAFKKFRASFPQRIDWNGFTGRALRAGKVSQIAPIVGNPKASLQAKELAKDFGYDAMLLTPLMKDGKAIGAIGTTRPESEPFDARQLALFEAFAAQAVIAIENTRLFNETKEALERQTATADVLQVISGSPTNVQPVFEAILESATRLCEAELGGLFLNEAEHWRMACYRGDDPAVQESFRRVAAGPNTGLGKLVRERKPVHIVDLLADAQTAHRDPLRVATIEKLRARTFLAVPLVKEGTVLGAVVIYRREVRPFAEAQIRLVSTFADQAVIAIENVRLFNETKESLERQTATSEILRVIAASPTDVQPVFDSIIANAVRLCRGVFGAVYRYEGGLIHLKAWYNFSAEALESMRQRYPQPAADDSLVAQSVRTASVIDVPDIDADPSVPSGSRSTAQALGYRSQLTVPLLRDGMPIGAIVVAHKEVGGFAAEQVDLLRMFADQAVIAIENVRLLNETKEAFDQQKASAEVLGAISGSIADTKPVFEKIVESCQRLFSGKLVGINLVGDDGMLHLSAYNGPNRERFEKVFPLALDGNSGSGLAIVQRRILHVPDVEAEGVPEAARRGNRATGTRAALFAPMMWQDKAIGAVFVAREHAGPFSEKEITLLSTFASQAVIAIQNARLVNETREALEQQTATAEVLKVISSSPTDVAPVFDAILRSAVSLCGAELAAVFPFDGKLVHLGATHNWPPAALQYFSKVYPAPPSPKLLSGRTILAKSIVQIADSAADPSYDPNSVITGHWRRMLGAPMLREGRPLGALVVAWRDPGETPPRQVDLLQTFADQAAIAIENVRLFNETKEALDQQKASAEVLGAISGSIADTKPVFEKILASCERLFEGELVGITLADGDTVRLIAYHGPQGEHLKKVYPLPLTRESGTGWAILNAKIAHFPDIEAKGVPPGVVAGCRTLRVRAIVFAPMLFEGKGIGAIWVARAQPGAFTDKQISQLRTFADQAVIAIQNARLFREIQEKSAQLEVANKHKSDFLANMSHELRTPLNAIIGFSEVLSERMFGEVNEKQAEYLKDIHESGRHLLSLINDILDLSKIEAGRMELELSSFDLPSAVSNAMTLVRERAQRHGIQLGVEIDPRLGVFEADERKVKQILINLLSNAVKFTPDGGRVDVSAKLDTGKVEIAVKDTGIGIAPEDHAAVFEEFKQVGRDYTRKAEGTGLGLALTRRLVELHGGEIALESAIGKGSTFTVKLPLR